MRQLLNNWALAPSVESGVAQLASTLLDGSALARFCAMLKGQGVQPTLADQLCAPGADLGTLLPRAKHRTNVTSLGSGQLKAFEFFRGSMVL